MSNGSVVCVPNHQYVIEVGLPEYNVHHGTNGVEWDQMEWHSDEESAIKEATKRSKSYEHIRVRKLNDD